MILNLLSLSVSVFVVAQLIPGIRIKNYGTAVVVAIVYSLVNFLLDKLLLILAFPLIFFTLGLFVFVINAFLLWLTDQIIDDFEIRDFKTTLIAAACISLLNMLLQWIF